MPWQREATEDWQDRFEALARAKNIEDNAIDGQHPSSKMMDLFLTLIGKDAYAQIKTLVAPEKPHMKTYGDVKSTFYCFPPCLRSELYPQTSDTFY